MAKKKDFGFDNLLALNGDRYFIDDKGEFDAFGLLKDFWNEVDKNI